MDFRGVQISRKNHMDEKKRKRTMIFVFVVLRSVQKLCVVVFFIFPS